MSFQIIPSEEINFRYDLPLLIDARGFKDAVEVGVDQGEFARVLLGRSKLHWLFLVDPYEPYDEMDYLRTLDAMTALQALREYHGRFRFIQARSPGCIPLVRALISPEFVYVDGSHTEADCYADLRAWWDILPTHGCLAGHDHDETHPGVMAAVGRFAREEGAVVRLTSGDATCTSWYIYKTEPEHLMVRLFRDATEPNPHYGVESAWPAESEAR